MNRLSLTGARVILRGHDEPQDAALHIAGGRIVAVGAEVPSDAEQVALPNLILAPGIIDTGMQIQLRGADSADFAAQPVFEGFHEGGALDSPERAAAKVLEILFADDFGRLPVADVRD